LQRFWGVSSDEKTLTINKTLQVTVRETGYLYTNLEKCSRIGDGIALSNKEKVLLSQTGNKFLFENENSSFVLHEWFITLNCYPHGMIIQNRAIKEI
jgi:hypothetical protein